MQSVRRGKESPVCIRPRVSAAGDNVAAAAEPLYIHLPNELDIAECELDEDLFEANI